MVPRQMPMSRCVYVPSRNHLCKNGWVGGKVDRWIGGSVDRFADSVSAEVQCLVFSSMVAGQWLHSKPYVANFDPGARASPAFSPPLLAETEI